MMSSSEEGARLRELADRGGVGLARAVVMVDMMSQRRLKWVRGTIARCVLVFGRVLELSAESFAGVPPAS